jgi:hypothetical protein
MQRLRELSLLKLAACTDHKDNHQPAPDRALLQQIVSASQLTTAYSYCTVFRSHQDWERFRDFSDLVTTHKQLATYCRNKMLSNFLVFVLIAPSCLFLKTVHSSTHTAFK